MSNTTLDADRILAEHSEQEVSDFVGELVRRIWERLPASRVTLPIKNGDGKPLGYVVPLDRQSPDPELAEFIASGLARMDNPAAEYVGFDEFVALLTERAEANKAKIAS